MSDSRFVVVYRNPIMGDYSAIFGTEDEARQEASYDTRMNGNTTQVLKVETIATYSIEENTHE